jgi:hypothetical protein
MLATQLNTVCASLQNIDKVSLHTDDPGNNGANDSGETKQTLTWSTPSQGMMKATATFEDVEGTYTHIGLWDGTVFIEGRTLNVTLPVAQDLVVLVEIKAEVKTGSSGGVGVSGGTVGGS